MNIIDSKTNEELERSILAEVAKASAELKCAQADVVKAQGRLSFVIAVVNELINRGQRYED